MKKYIFLAVSALTLASCSSDDFIGEGQGNTPSAANTAISFSGSAGKITRADNQKNGKEAATALNKKFIVFGTKTISDKANTVYDHYNVNWKTPTQNEGEGQTATASWVYAGEKMNSLNQQQQSHQDATQSLKYWDYAATQYDFVAFSFGEVNQGTGDNDVEATKVSNTDYSYTLKGKTDNLVKCYVANKVTVKSGDFKKPVSFTFRQLGTYVNIGIYETIPGYSVKDVKYHKSDNDNNPTETPTLYASSNTINNLQSSGKETIKVTFDQDGKCITTWQATSNTASPARPNATRSDGNEENNSEITGGNTTDNNKTSYITFDKLNMTSAESLEGGNNDYLGRDSKANASKPNSAKAILPCENVGELTLKVDYTLVSIDGSGETITVKGATAKIASKYTNWSGNTSYTYIFKISDKTNGSTGTGDNPQVGLYPIEFDAVVENVGGSEEEIELKKDEQTQP